MLTPNKGLFTTIILLAFFQTAWSQSARSVIKFNHNWEMYRIDSLHKLKSIENVRNSTSFLSQFNQENIRQQTTPADSIRKHEISEAIRGFGSEYPQIKLLKWEKISLPHPARYETELNPGVNQFTGICYYRKYFEAPVDAQNKHLYIRFEGAMQTASIWVNGKFIKQHQGGYLPFVVDLDGIVKAGQKNEIIVRLDNNDNVNLPPGRRLAKLGFLYWSGIYRDVWLITTNKIFVTDESDANTVAGGGIFVRTENISSSSADVIIKTQIKNTTKSSALVVKQIISNAVNKDQFFVNQSEIVVDRDSIKNLIQKIVVQHPDLWSPDAPNLYLLTTEVWNNGVLVDDYSQKIGIRKLSFTRTEGFKINDHPVRIVGTNRHQDFVYVGNAMSDAMQCRDLKRIKEAGFNFIRLSHYPQDPSVYKYCDSIGLMLGDPIPGWQFFNRNDIFKERVFSDIRQMVRRDRNHPSVVMWEVSLNETYPADTFRIKSAQIAHEEFPGDNFFTSGDTYGAKHTAWDVPYNNWVEPFGRPQDVQPDKPGFAREYGDYEFGGSSSTTRVNSSNGEKALLKNAWNFQWEHNLLMGPKYYPWTVGDATWAFYDAFEAFTKGTSDWGVMDIYREPKFGYYFFRSQLSPVDPVYGADNKPMVYIANWWVPKNNAQKVIIYSNCDEVALFINGRFIRKQRPDNGPDTDYGNYEKGGHPFDGGNGKNLNHPPFTFNHIKWERGELKAIGYIKGKKVADQAVNTPQAKTSIKLIKDDEGIQLTADGADAVFVHAELVDAKGTVMCLDNDTKVHFSINGNGKIIGPNVVKTRGGIASILVQAGESPDTIIISATTGKLSSAHLTITSADETDTDH